jgi:hypothetical protein
MWGADVSPCPLKQANFANTGHATKVSQVD